MERTKQYIVQIASLTLILLAGIMLTAGGSGPPPESPVDKYQRSWEHRALGIQRTLDLRAPLSRAVFLSTHNSYNSSEYTTAASYWDPNHNHTIYDQLRLDVRQLELDIHWYFSMQGWPWNWGKKPLLCHGQNNHVGCSTYDRHLKEGIKEINNWIRRSENRNEVIMLYLEEHLDGHYSEALNVIKAYLGDLIYRPVGSCQGIPMNISKADILNSGKQILLITNGCSGNEWSRWVFSGIADRRGYPESNAENFRSYPDCGSARFSRDDYNNYMIRFYEDRTNLTAWFGGGSGKIYSGTMAQMMQCGVGLASMDKLTPTDGRLQAAVWSWHPGEPNNWGGNEDCAQQWGNGRWNDANCNNSYRFACRNGAGNWYVTNASGPWRLGDHYCSTETNGQYRFAVPVNGHENRLLHDLKRARGASSVWLGVSDQAREGAWTP